MHPRGLILLAALILQAPFLMRIILGLSHGPRQTPITRPAPGFLPRLRRPATLAALAGTALGLSYAVWAVDAVYFVAQSLALALYLRPAPAKPERAC